MRVILLENIPKLGKKFEVKEVKAGYVRNFLLPRRMVIVATQDNTQKIEAIKEREKETQQVFEEKLNKISKNAEKLTLNFQKKANAEGKLFGSIDEKEIKKALEDYGIKVNKGVGIELDKPLKKVGTYHINLILRNKKIPLKIQIKRIKTR